MAGLMFGLKRKAKLWRQSFAAGVSNTGNVSARSAASWCCHGTGRRPRKTTP